MSGIDREIFLDRKHIAKHLPNTVPSDQLRRRGRSAHLFNDEATLLRVAQAIIETGTHTGFARGYDHSLMQINDQTRSDFDQALGESFGDYVSPPIPFDDASPHECCEALWEVLGPDITPTQLAQRSPETIATIAQTLFRWPIDSLGEEA